MLESLFTDKGTIDVSKLEGMTQDDLMKLVATLQASKAQNQPSPFAAYQQLMGQQRQPAMQAPPIKRAQAPNILNPLEELMRMQQMQQMQQRPQSLI